jgi:transposase-like protein
MYSQEKIGIALNLYYQCRSVTKTVRTLGYPTKKTLYVWVHNEGKPKKQRKALELINTKSHPRNPSVEIKIDALHRCFELGESIKSVSEDIGYTRAAFIFGGKSIYQRVRLH